MQRIIINFALSGHMLGKEEKGEDEPAEGGEEERTQRRGRAGKWPDVKKTINGR